MTIAPPESAPAKINLFFHITGRRNDGYHFIDSLVAFAALADTISLTESSRDEIILSGPFANDAPVAWTDNLVGKAVDFFRNHVAPTPPLSIQIDKKIPSGAGLGGGSADAGACLRVLQRAYAPGKIISPVSLAVLGADVPICFVRQSAQTTGVGEQIAPLAIALPWSMVLVKPTGSISTIDAYAHYKKSSSAFRAPTHITAENILNILRAAENDLQPAAYHLLPAVSDALRALEKTRPLLHRMTGSGSCCFGLYENEEDAAHAQRKLVSDYPDWWVRTTLFLS